MIITDKHRKRFRKVFAALSLTSALFVFQACYGTPGDFGMDAVFTGVVLDKATNKPIPGIKVSLENHPQYELTDSTGKFQIYASIDSVYKLKFEDIDSTNYKVFHSKDTIVSNEQRANALTILLDAK